MESIIVLRVWSDIKDFSYLSEVKSPLLVSEKYLLIIKNPIFIVNIYALLCLSEDNCHLYFTCPVQFLLFLDYRTVLNVKPCWFKSQRHVIIFTWIICISTHS